MEAATYFELDLDIYRVTSFERDKDSGTAVKNWTSRWATGVTFNGGTSGAVMTRTGSDANALMSMDRMTSLQNISTVGGFTLNSLQDDVSLAVRASGSAGSQNGYLLRLSDSTTSPATLEIIKVVSGSETVLETGEFEYTSGDLVWMKLEAITTTTGTTIRGKIWSGELSNEPATFTIFVSDTSSPINSAGWCGISTLDTNGQVTCTFYRARGYFDDERETHRYAIPTAGLDTSSPACLPNILNASISPGVISLGENLGTRSRVNVSFRDHPHADDGEGYERGTYWGKFRARRLFRRGADARLKLGELGQDLSSFETRYYKLETFSGPSPRGTFEVTAQDLLKAADNDRSQAPILSNGYLLSGIGGNDTSATLSPSGIGNLEYPSSGYVAIGGKEICLFTRSGDTLTLTRGQFGTTATSHSGDDRVQLCLYYDAQTPAEIIEDLLVNYAGVDASFIPSSTWADEVENYLDRVYTRLIADPTGVNKLVSEMIEQAGLAVWFDDRTNQVRLQVLRGIPIDAYTYDPDRVLEGINITEQASKRITQVWTYYGVRNPLEPLTEPNNYRSTLATGDFEAESEDGVAVIRKIFAAWIPTFAEQSAQRVNDLLLGRFVTPPRRFTFSVMRGSGVQEPLMGAGYRVKWYGYQDEKGDSILTGAPVQVVRVTPKIDRWDVEAEEMLFKQFDAADLTSRVVTINSNINNIDLKTLHDQAYPVLTDDDVSNGVTLTIIVAAGVTVGSTDVDEPALTITDEFPSGLPITLIVNGRIQGKGGNGGATDLISPNAEDGGTALYVRHPIDLTVDSGEVWGGGGGGAWRRGGFGNPYWPAGGGAGTNVGLKYTGTLPAGYTITDATDTTGGNATTFPGGTIEGGDGGGPGLPGTAGTGGSSFGSPGAAGNAIDGVSYVTVTGGAGDVRGPEIN